VAETAGEGVDTVQATVSYTLGTQVERLLLLGTANLSGTGNELVNILTGNAGANRLDGREGGDRLYGLGGDDHYVVDAAGDRVYEASGGGTDAVQAGVSYTLPYAQEIETLAAAGTAAIDLAGNTFGQALIGNAGANVLDGRLGADTLTGGAGEDAFTFSTLPGTANVDRVTDFSVTDTIRLENAVFRALGAAGALDPAAFHIGAAAADGSDRIVYEASTGDLFYDRDGTGGAAQVRVAQLSANLALTEVDVLVI
jgi:Ca2+-binding RTX toxin-like protein